MVNINIPKETLSKMLGRQIETSIVDLPEGIRTKNVSTSDYDINDNVTGTKSTSKLGLGE